jgi:hypothetical protein
MHGLSPALELLDHAAGVPAGDCRDTAIGGVTAVEVGDWRLG